MVWTSPCKPWNKNTEAQQHFLRYAWTHGDLHYKLDPLQRQVRDKIDAYFAQFDDSTNSYARIYILDMSRRLGKDFIQICKMCEELNVNIEHIYVYATAYYKQLIEILEPLLKIILMDCPPERELKELKYRHHWQHPVTGSILKMCGLDKDPDSLRGPRCDGAVVTEAGYCDGLTAAESAFLPQLLDNPRAWRIYGCTATDNPSHPWESVIIPEANERGNISHHELDESPRYTVEQIEAAYNEFGGRESEQSKLEYRCIHGIATSRALIPEWAAAKDACVVESYPRPDAAHAYLGLDPGMSDLSGIPAGYLDFEADMLVIERAEAEPQLNTEQLANLVKKIESDLGWNDFYYFDAQGSRYSNPYKRVADRDPRLIADLMSGRDEDGKPFGLSFEAALKHDLLTGISMLRTRIARRKIRIIVPAAKKLVTHLDSAIWNKQRTAPERTNSPILGHFDLVMALVYLNRSINPTISPFNPIMTYSSGQHVVYPQAPPASGWAYERNEAGEIIS